MKIAPRQAEAFLKNPAAEARALLVYGPDEGLARERAAQARRQWLGEASDPFALAEFGEAALLADPALLADELCAISLLGGRRLVLIRDATDKCAALIADASAHFHAHVFLIVLAGDLPSRSALRAWFEKESAAAALACYKDDARDVGELIRRAFEEAGVSAGREVIAYLASQLGNDRHVTRREIEKAILYAGEGKTLSLAEAEALVDYNRDANMDEMNAALADRNLAALDTALARLRRDGVNPVSCLRGLQRYFNRLYALCAQVEAGISPDQAVAAARPPVFFRAVPAMTRHLSSWRSGQLARALTLLAEAELACKTTDMPAASASARKLMQITQIR